MIHRLTHLTLVASAAAVLLLSGCAGTMSDPQRNTGALQKSVQSAVAPGAADVEAYRAFTEHNSETMMAVVEALKASPSIPVAKPEFGRVVFSYKDAIGRTFAPELEVVRAFRFPVPQDALDAESKEVGLLVDAIGLRLAEWCRLEPIEILAISATPEGAELMAVHLRRTAPSIKVATRVGSMASAGAAGVELRMINLAPQRTVGVAKPVASSAGKPPV